VPCSPSMVATCRCGAAIQPASTTCARRRSPPQCEPAEDPQVHKRGPGYGGQSLDSSGAMHGPQRASPPWPVEIFQAYGVFHRRMGRKHELFETVPALRLRKTLSDRRGRALQAMISKSKKRLLPHRCRLGIPRRQQPGPGSRGGRENYRLIRSANCTTRGSVTVLVMVPKAALPKAAVRLRELGTIGNVEDLGPELDISFFADAGVLDQGHVQIAKVGTTHGIARGAPQRELRSRRKGRGVKELRRGAHSVDQARPVDEVGPLENESEGGVVVGGLGDGDRHAGLELQDGVQAPAANYFFGDARGGESGGPCRQAGRRRCRRRSHSTCRRWRRRAPAKG